MTTGNATYYCSCYGGDCDSLTGGACEDCYDASFHIAWPYVFSDLSCGASQEGCHTNMEVYDECTGRSRIGSVEDACPCERQEGCDRTPRCNGSDYTDPNYTTPLLDLTTAFFMWLNGSLDDGRIPIDI